MKIGRKVSFTKKGTAELIAEIKHENALKVNQGSRSISLDIKDMALDQKAVDEACDYIISCNDKGTIIVSPQTTDRVRFIIQRQPANSK